MHICMYISGWYARVSAVSAGFRSRAQPELGSRMCKWLISMLSMKTYALEEQPDQRESARRDTLRRARAKFEHKSELKTKILVVCVVSSSIYYAVVVYSRLPFVSGQQGMNADAHSTPACIKWSTFGCQRQRAQSATAAQRRRRRQCLATMTTSSTQQQQPTHIMGRYS